MSPWLLVDLKATGKSAIKVVRILVALKATVESNVNSHCRQDFGSALKAIIDMNVNSHCGQNSGSSEDYTVTE